jgi:Ca2+/Na+ antiporter
MQREGVGEPADPQHLRDPASAGHQHERPRAAAVTSLPNAVATVFLARRGRASATLSEAFNSNTLNVLAGLLIPAVIITGPRLGGALPIAIWYGVLTAATIALALAGRGINRRSGALIIAAYLVFAITVIANAIRPPL